MHAVVHMHVVRDGWSESDSSLINRIVGWSVMIAVVLCATLERLDRDSCSCGGLVGTQLQRRELCPGPE